LGVFKGAERVRHRQGAEDFARRLRRPSAYSGECFEDLLSLGGFESLIHEKGARNHPLSDAAKELNRVKSSIRTCVEHVFGCMTMSMGGKLTRKIGLERNEAWWGLKNLTFNFLRYLQRSSQIATVA